MRYFVAIIAGTACVVDASAGQCAPCACEADALMLADFLEGGNIPRERLSWWEIKVGNQVA